VPKVLSGGGVEKLEARSAFGFIYIPAKTLAQGPQQDLRVFRRKIFGPVIRVDHFKDEAEALGNRQTASA